VYRTGTRVVRAARAGRWARLCAIAIGALACAGPGRAQDARWVQLTRQVQQLGAQGKGRSALPLAQEAVQVSRATYGPADRHVGR
jgi:hypothetical protein